MSIIRKLGHKAAMSSIVASMAVASSGAWALSFEFGDVELSANFLVSAGATIRTEDRDYSLINKRSHPDFFGFVAGEEVLCADPGTGGDPGADGGATEDLLGGCVLNAAEHQRFVDAPGSFTQNADQGNINYDKGDVVHAALKTTLDLDIMWEDYGLFARMIAFYDPTAIDYSETHTDTIHQPGSTLRGSAIEDEIGFSAELEDFYAYGSWDVFDRTLSLSVGKQIVSWGESLTFVVNSINSANAPNVIRLNTPGLDLKELFTPTEMVKAGIDLTENLSMEAFYQLKWRPIIIPPIGDFFSTSDAAGTGNGYAMLAFGKEPEDLGNIQDQYVPNTPEHAAAMGRGCINDGTNFGDDLSIYDAQANKTAYGIASNPETEIDDRLAEFGFYQAEREGEETAGRTICLANGPKPDDGGQFGLKFNYYAAWLNDTEFGFYYMNYHSRLPYASFIATDINDDASSHTLHGLISTLFAVGTQPNGSLEEDDADVLGALTRVDTAAVFLEYPEDIQMYGMSFNTTVGDVSVSGEVAYRPNLPLQINTVDATLFSLSPSFNQSRDAAGPTYLEAYRFAHTQDQAALQALKDQGMSNYEAYWALNNGRGPNGIYTSNRNGSEITNIGTSVIPAGAIIHAYERLPVANISSTLLYATSTNPFAADQWILIGDIASTQVFDMPSLDELQFGAPGDDNWYGVGRNELDNSSIGNGGVPCNEVTNVLTNAIGLDGSATPIDTVIGVISGLADPGAPAVNTNCAVGLLRQTPISEDGSTFATPSSWGFRVLSFLKYNNLIFGANLNQLIGVFVDVNGNSPGPAGNFVEGRKRFLWGSEFTKGDWTMNFKYNWFTGAGDRNLENDRDNFSVDIRYSF